MSLNSLLLAKYKRMLEARAGIEPAHKGFADLSLTTWVPRLDDSTVTRLVEEIQPITSLPIEPEAPAK